MSWLVGIDTGGTFTDLAATDTVSGKIITIKVPSVPSNPAIAVMNAVSQLVTDHEVEWSQIELLAHGTTVATNAILEGKGAMTGLLVNKGLKAIYPMRAGVHPNGSDLIDPYYSKSPELVPQALTKEVRGRVAYDGSEIEPISDEDIENAVSQLLRQGVTSIAVCFLFSFVNSKHEVRVRELIHEMAANCRVSISSEVLPVIREYPRLSTTVLDAYVGPVVANYLEELGASFAAFGVNTERFYVMQSSGGLKRMKLAVRYPNETLLSGPAAGVIFSQKLAEQTGYNNMVTFDMGGTSADMSVILSGAVDETREGAVAGQDLGTPMIRIRTIGSGGGSIAYLGDDGLLKVGPQSAGADPGPACYGRGGTQPTVTDANVRLGYLSVNNFLGGRMRGDASLAQKALEDLSAKIGIDEVVLARGILKIVDTQMAVGLRMALMERGADPRNFVLSAFGGSGPIHAVRLAKELGVSTILIPQYPGIACSMGLLNTVTKYVYLQSYIRRFSDVEIGDILTGFFEMKDRALKDREVEGLDDHSSEFIFQIDVRYPRQGYELPITLEHENGIPRVDLVRLSDQFHKQHQNYYGVSAPDEEPQLVNLRLTMSGKLPQMQWSIPERFSGQALKENRDAWFDSANGFVSTPVYDRMKLPVGARIEGPAIIEQSDSATLIEPGAYVTIDQFGNIVIRLLSEEGEK